MNACTLAYKYRCNGERRWERDKSYMKKVRKKEGKEKEK